MVSYNMVTKQLSIFFPTHSGLPSEIEERIHIRANALEAVIGAVYLDGGLDQVKEVLARLYFPEKVNRLCNYEIELQFTVTFILFHNCLYFGNEILIQS